MKEPASLDLFSDDVCPSPSEYLRLRVCRQHFFDALEALRDANSRRYAFGFCVADARLSLWLLGGLGGVW